MFPMIQNCQFSSFFTAIRMVATRKKAVFEGINPRQPGMQNRRCRYGSARRSKKKPPRDCRHSYPGEDILRSSITADLQLLVVVAGARPPVPSIHVRYQVNGVDAGVGIKARREADVNIDGHAGYSERENQDVLLSSVPYTKDAE